MGNDRMLRPGQADCNGLASKNVTVASSGIVSHETVDSTGAVSNDTPTSVAAFGDTSWDNDGNASELKRHLNGQASDSDKPEKELLTYENGDVRSFRVERSPTGELFPCMGCTDVFNLRTSLIDHLQRKTVLVQINCPGCLRKRTFYNKCLVFRHMRSHYVDATVQKLEAIACTSSVMPLPQNYAMMPRSVAEELQALDIGVQALANLKTSQLTALAMPPAAATVQLPSAQPPLQLPAVVQAPVGPPLAVQLPRTATVLQPVRAVAGCQQLQLPSAPLSLFTCTECAKPFPDHSQLQAHFGKPQKGVAVTLRHTCSTCGKALFSGCALRAHSRIHSRLRPFVCPECACVVPGDYAVFEKHVLFKCHHRSRLLEYSCAVCSEVFETLQRLQLHWSLQPTHCLMAHYDVLSKCSECPMAFKSMELFIDHNRTTTKASCATAKAVSVYVCRSCDKVYRSLDELSIHNGVDHNHDLTQRRPATACYVFRCELCISPEAKFKNLQHYNNHLQEVHRRSVITEMCDICGDEFKNSEQLSNHLFTSHGSKEGIIRTKDFIPTKARDGTGTQRTHDESKAGASDAVGQALCSAAEPMTLPEPATARLPVGTRARDQMFNCHLCGLRFTTYSSLKEHATADHNGLGQLLICWICSEKSMSHKSFNNPASLDRHISEVHKIAVGCQQSSASSSSPDTSVDESKSDYSWARSSPSPAVKRRKLADSTGEPAKNKCSCCGLVSHSRAQFLEHIRKHREAVDSCQCAECGMCFPVEPALRRHLFVVHHIQDFVSYFREHGAAPAEPGLATMPRGTKVEGQCLVCSRRFDTDAALKIHARTHGMAFITAKRAQNSSGKSGSEDDSNDQGGGAPMHSY